jgi:hypothetical protein
VFENIISTYTQQAGAIAYHMNWPNPLNPFCNDAGLARRAFYNINTLPAGAVDGMLTIYTSWLSTFQTRLLISAPITITLSGTYSPILHNAYITAHVHCESVMSGTGHHIYVAITQDDLYSQGRHYNRVERAINANGLGEVFSINPGEDKDYSCTLAYSPSWSPSNLKLLCWVQAGQSSTKQAQNTKWEPWSILTPAIGVTPASLGGIKAAFQ